ncbi:AAA family ATPase [Kitasatospora sp. NBC_01250]|uniref:AfsR/SARP family transcriptional regulator n=1 Tax=Kitasatospora sp. NBC_01250 TaxID=2903571 RepID=UPI002E30B1FE|nr:BTAD domain-containing putative transcriptional regulator [Kitasatospora sp. NBC_01250]
MRIDLLGAVAVRYDDGAAATPSAPKRRALLAALAVRLGRLTPTEQLIELVWDGSPPPTARAALQGHIAELRRLLDGRLELATRGAGYLLAGDPDQVDALRFERLCREAGLLLPDPAAPAAARAAARAAADPVAAAPPAGSEPDPALPLLRAALDLWRGPALTDCGSALLRERTAPRLTDLRLRALDRLADGLRRRGRGAELIAELTEAVPAHPTHEQLAVHLLACLDQAGRGAEALEWYDRVAAQLPAAPGPALRAARDRLARTPSPVPGGAVAYADDASSPRTATPSGARAAVAPPRHLTPAQLPRANRRFVGRTGELDHLDGAIAAGRENRPILVTGPAGVGKTSLVQHWAHRVAHRFPDGQLYADLRGFDETEPREAAEVLACFLAALGVAESAMPSTLEDRSRRYRALLSGRRLLVVLDNARSYEQLSPLLPDPPADDAAPDGGPVTVITSRSRLGDLLVQEGAAPLSLDVLTPAEALELLARVLDPARVAAEPQAAAELAERCDRLPLALRLAAARLATRPGWALRDLVTEISDEQARLASLSCAGRGSLGVAATLNLTCRALPAAAVQLFTLLGLHPGAVIDAHTAAVLADVPPVEVRGVLAQLDAAHLIEETAPGLFARHDLVRLYGAQLAAELTCDERLAAMDRMIDHYLAATAAACAGLNTHSVLPTGTPAAAGTAMSAGTPAPAGSAASAVASPSTITSPSTASLPPLATPGQAVDWFRREERAVRGVVLCAEHYERSAAAWQLAHQAGVLYYNANHGRPEWRSTAEAGLRAARACADPAALVRMHADLAVVLIDQREFRAASDHLDQAIALADELGDPVLRHQCRTRLANGLVRAGRQASAIPLMTDIVDRARELTDDRLLAQALNNLANALVIAGTPELALPHADEAVRILTARPEDPKLPLAAHTRAEVLHALGRHNAALAAARHALALGRAQGNLRIESQAHALLATLLHALSRTAEALAEERLADTLPPDAG